MNILEDRQPQIDKLLRDLQIISNLAKYEKLIIKTDNEIDIDRRHFQSIRRYISGDCRDCLVKFIETMANTLTKEIDFLSSVITGDHEFTVKENALVILHDFYIHLFTSRRGFLNLIDTYSDDIPTKSKLELYYNTLDRKYISLRCKLNITPDNAA
jgi:hypothetical protein